MTITREIDLDDKDRLAICRVIRITEKLGTVTGRSRSEVFEYFLDKAERLVDGSYSIIATHQLDDME